jgi:hypothetical protein
MPITRRERRGRRVTTGASGGGDETAFTKDGGTHDEGRRSRNRQPGRQTSMYLAVMWLL